MEKKTRKKKRTSPKESTWWSSYFKIFVCHCLSFPIYKSYICIFLPTEDCVNIQRKRECMIRTERQPPGNVSRSISFIIPRGALLFLCKTEESPRLLSEWLMGNIDCVVNTADRYCYRPFLFFKNFSYILLLFIITVVQMLFTVYSLWGIMVLQYAVYKIDRKYFFIC